MEVDLFKGVEVNRFIDFVNAIGTDLPDAPRSNYCEFNIQNDCYKSNKNDTER